MIIDKADFIRVVQMDAPNTKPRAAVWILQCKGGNGSARSHQFSPVRTFRGPDPVAGPWMSRLSLLNVCI